MQNADVFLRVTTAKFGNISYLIVFLRIITFYSAYLFALIQALMALQMQTAVTAY